MNFFEPGVILWSNDPTAQRVCDIVNTMVEDLPLRIEVIDFLGKDNWQHQLGNGWYGRIDTDRTLILYLGKATKCVEHMELLDVMEKENPNTVQELREALIKRAPNIYYSRVNPQTTPRHISLDQNMICVCSRKYDRILENYLCALARIRTMDPGEPLFLNPNDGGFYTGEVTLFQIGDGEYGAYFENRVYGDALLHEIEEIRILSMVISRYRELGKGLNPFKPSVQGFWEAIPAFHCQDILPNGAIVNTFR